MEFCNGDVILSYILWDGLNILYESYRSLLNLWVFTMTGKEKLILNVLNINQFRDFTKKKLHIWFTSSIASYFEKKKYLYCNSTPHPYVPILGFILKYLPLRHLSLTGGFLSLGIENEEIV